MQRKPWHSLPNERVLAELSVNPEEGLSLEEVKKRLAQYGSNQLPEAAPVSFWARLWQQLSDVMVLTLFGAAVVSALLAYFFNDEGGSADTTAAPNKVNTITSESCCQSLTQKETGGASGNWLLPYWVRRFFTSSSERPSSGLTDNSARTRSLGKECQGFLCIVPPFVLEIFSGRPMRANYFRCLWVHVIG